MKQMLKDIQTGEYAKSFILENRAGAPTLLSRRRLMAEHPIEMVGEQAARDDAVDQEEPAGRPDRATERRAPRLAARRDRAPIARSHDSPTHADGDAADGRRRAPRRKGIYILPNLFTLGGAVRRLLRDRDGDERALRAGGLSASSAPWCSTASTAASRA